MRASTSRVAFLFVSSSLLALPLAAQRNAAKLSAWDREVVLEYGPAPAGKHTLSELPAGREWPKDADPVQMLRGKGLLRTSYGPAWRLGMNEASVLKTQLPLLAGETVVAPGSYRACLHRDTETELMLILASGGLAVGQNADLVLKGELRTAKVAAEKLAIEWTPATLKSKKDLELDTKLVVRYGTHELVVPLKVVGARGAKLPGYQVDVFAYDGKWLAERQASKLPTPWLSLRSAAAKKEKDTFNLVVTGEKCSLLQLMSAPTEAFGFDNVNPPTATLTTDGAVATAKASAAKPALEAEKCERSGKGELTFRLVFGETAAAATLPDATLKLAKS